MNLEKFLFIIIKKKIKLPDCFFLEIVFNDIGYFSIGVL